jgi:hypothetical protein
VRAYPGERATLDGNTHPTTPGNGINLLTVNGGYTWYWGLELTNSCTIRHNPTSGSNPPDARGEGFFIVAPGIKVINCVVHDTGEGVFCGPSAKDAELYGNIIYYNGWNAQDRAHGHGIYVQNYTGGVKLIRHNILFDPFSYNLCAYGSSAAGFVNSKVDGNVWWRGRSLVGGENGFDIGGTSITGNFSWSAPLSIGGSTTKCANVAVSGNYLTNLGGVMFSPGSAGCRAGETITTNTFVGDLSGFAQGDYPNNTYYAKEGPPTQGRVTILPNTYEPGRATIVVYNWEHIQTARIDLAGIVAPGAAFEIRNARNVFGPSVIGGTYTGRPVMLPMSALPSASPIGYAAPPPTGPAFDVFIVIPSRKSASPGPDQGRSKGSRDHAVATIDATMPKWLFTTTCAKCPRSTEYVCSETPT